jgi:hypothetical protein
MGIFEELKYFEKINFNIGAFVLTPIWCFVHGELFSSISMIILMILPYVFPIPKAIYIIVKILIFLFSLYYGIKGNAIAMNCEKYKDKDEFEYFNKKWTFAGIISLILYFTFSSIFHNVNAGFSIFKIGIDAITSY